MSQATSIVKSPAMPARSPGRACSARSRSASWSTPPPASAARPAKWLAWSGTICRFATTSFDNTYQTMPDTEWNLLEPDQIQRAAEGRRRDEVADAQGPVHALRRSGLPGAPARPTAPSCSTPTASSTFSRNTASAASTALPAARSTFPSSIPQPRRSTSARCVRTAWAQVWNPPASRRVQPAACTSAPRTT